MRIGESVIANWNDNTGDYTIEMLINLIFTKKPDGAGFVILGNSVLIFLGLLLLSFNIKVRTSVASLKRS